MRGSRKLTDEERQILFKCLPPEVALAKCEQLWYTKKFELVFARFVSQTKREDLSLRDLARELTAMRKQGTGHYA